MGCSSCAAKSAASSQLQQMSFKTSQQTQEILDEPCEFTTELIKEWLEKVTCAKNKGLYITYPNFPKNMINSYIGILMSALIKKNNLCYFKDQLKEIQNFVIIIINTGQC